MDWKRFIKDNIDALVPYAPGLREEQVRDIARTDVLHKLSSNENPYPPFPSALEAMAESLVSLNEYCDGSAHELTEKLSTHYGVTPEQIIVGNGSNELLDLIGEVCLQPTDEVVYCWPSFVVYRSLTQIAQAKSVECPLDAGGAFDLDAILGAITARTKLVLLCSPNNPTGGVVGKAAFELFLSQLPDHVLLVIDEAYIEYVTPGTTFNALDYFDGERPLVILRTFSKIYSLAGVRCGYGIAPAPLAEALDKVREPFNVNSVAQAGALACFGDETEVERRRIECAEGRERLYACLDRLALTYVRSQANFVWVEVPDADRSFRDLLERGVIVRSFAQGGNALRITVGNADGVTATIDALEEIMG